ncbi:unnamed protein product [Coregonus sp. 'balchen']|nr:unnamed protein product [Coregonus sp. 'balchen']CAB1325640.1 unnamed protein product [Coregonus sp. 'balchen']CAB1345371.1 unnamed protein product [Coregonus sp. 'balchen']
MATEAALASIVTAETERLSPLFFEYPAEIKSEKGRINFKHRILRENPETLFADCSQNGTVTNLLFYTDHTTAWHTAVTSHFSYTTKKGICKGRQIHIFEDSDKDQENRFLTVNMYQNGTIMVQGSEAALSSVVQDFPTLMKIAESKKDKDSTLTSPLTSGTPTAGLSSPLPAYNHQSQDHTTISLLRDRLALLEVWVTELKEQPPSYTTPSPDTELLQDQINQCRTQLKNSVQELRESLTTALEEVKATMRRELVQVKEEMAKELSVIKRVLQQREQTVETPREKLQPLTTPNNPTDPPLPTIPPPYRQHFTHTPTPDRKRTNLVKPTEVAILIDSNGKFIQEDKLFPQHKVRKIWCPKTQDALHILSQPDFGTPGHIIIHTGTNNLREEQERVGSLVNRVAERASEWFPNSHITISTLLPRKDFHPRTIQKANADITRGCGLLPNIHIAHHPTITPEHLHDHSHLRKQTVGMFAKSLKDVALGRQTPHAVLDRGAPRDPYQTTAPPRSPRPLQRHTRPSAPHRPHPPPEHHHFHRLSQTRPGPAYYPAPDHHPYQTREEVPQPRPGPPPPHRAQQQDQRSYAEVVRGQENPVGLSEIKQLLQYICTKLH